MQSAYLCKEAYERAFIVENNLRAFASKVLIHFMGIDWLNSTRLEKEAESVKNLKQKFIKRVPEFENINADFLSMTLETLEKVMFERKVYKDTIVLDKSQYAKVLEIAENGKNANNVAEFIKSNRTVEKDIWNDLFVFTKNVGIFDTFHLEVIRNFKKMAFSEIVLAKSSWKFQV